MFKTVTVTLTALVLAVLSASPLNIGKVTEMKESRENISGGKKITPRDSAENKFIMSRDRAVRKQIVLNYARWYAKNKLGYTDTQWKKVRDMWYKESRWDWKAVNPSSGAAGIAQMKTESEIKNPFRQVELGFKYIKHRYGGPDEAVAYWDENGDY
jgi:hypothetical protein